MEPRYTHKQGIGASPNCLVVDSLNQTGPTRENDVYTK